MCMKRIGCFELRISLFNALGLAMATGVPTYLDPLLKSHILWEGRSYFLGYWVLMLAPFLFIGSIACILCYLYCNFCRASDPLVFVLHDFDVTSGFRTRRSPDAEVVPVWGGCVLLSLDVCWPYIRVLVKNGGCF